MKEMYNIYTKCIDKNILDEKKFMTMLNKPNHKIYTYGNKAFLVLSENNILLLCVDPKFQNQGIGTKLLLKAEKSIKENGYNRSNLGLLNNKSFLTGAPYKQQEFMFFDNLGYEDTNIVEDQLFNTDEKFNDSGNVNVEYLNPEEKAEFSKHLQSYDNLLLKELDPDKRIVVAKKDNQFIGHCQINFEKYKEFNDSIGLISNLFILPNYRKTKDAEAILKFCAAELGLNDIREFEIQKYNATMFSNEVKGKTYVKYYVGSKEL